jgi:hypothetical protein
MCNITIQQITAWIQANWAYVIAAASLFTAITPTPNPTTPWGKIYRVLDALALNVLHSKQTGVPAAQALQQVAAALEKEAK